MAGKRHLLIQRAAENDDPGGRRQIGWRGRKSVFEGPQRQAAERGETDDHEQDQGGDTESPAKTRRPPKAKRKTKSPENQDKVERVGDEPKHFGDDEEHARA